MQSCAASQRAFLPTSPGVDNEDAGQERASQRTKSKPQTTKELLTESHKDSAETISPGFWIRCNSWTFEELVKIIDLGFTPETNWVGLEWGPRICIFNNHVVYGPYF